MLEMVNLLQPRAVMIENVRGLLEPFHKFQDYREQILDQLRAMDYEILGWKVLEARDYGVPQLRPRAILVAMKKDEAQYFTWPEPADFDDTTVADALKKSMRARFKAIDRLDLYRAWLKKAKARGTVAPTLVGGSKKHGGADLGPTRAKRAWEELGIDAHGVAEDPAEIIKSPERDLLGPRGPKLTVQQAALIQGFPPEWVFEGGKTARYRQVGNAFPPPVAEAVGKQIIAALQAADRGDDVPVRKPEEEAPAPRAKRRAKAAKPKKKSESEQLTLTG
jgi:DNA (cytosine-5)-methyltransferase 1